MASPSPSALLREEYNDHSANYDDLISSAPIGILETQLLDSALGDCAGLTVLDLGGGSGLRARQALDHGAAAVDVVDLSPEMLRAGQSRAESNGGGGGAGGGGGGGRIAWHEADVSKPLDHVPALRPKKGAYDVVMANWVMDHAGSVGALEGMWANVAAYLRPGGRYVGTRCGDPRAPSALDPKYGIAMRDHAPIPGGLRYRYVTSTTPALDIEATSMEVSYSGSTEMHEKYGLVDVEVEPYENAEVIGEDPEFWKLFLEKPHMAVVKARKRM